MSNVDEPGKLRILLADSDTAMMEAIEAALEAALGLEALTFEKVHDGRTALERAERHRPDIMIVDANMPRMSGFMMLQKIRKIHGRRPYVIVTAEGCGKRHELYATQSLGAEAFYHKPVRMRRLVEKVTALMVANAGDRLAAGGEIAPAETAVGSSPSHEGITAGVARPETRQLVTHVA